MNKRIDLIASNVPAGVRSVYEVCCDHALISLALLKSGKAKRAVVSDISAKSIEKAKANLKGFPAEFIVCDGIDGSVEADLIVICGIGGMLMNRILDRYEGPAKLILSPQLNQDKVRYKLMEKGYAITADTCFEADGKYYDFIAAEKGSMELNEMQLLFGRFYTEKNEALRKKLTQRLAKIKKGNDVRKAKLVEEALKWQK